MILWLLILLFHESNAASFNVAFAAGVAARVETLLNEPFTRALDPLAAAFNSRWAYVYDGDDITNGLRDHALIDHVFDNETMALLWTLMKPTDLTGLQGFDFIYVGFENGKNFGYRNLRGDVVLYYMYDGNATCPENGLDIRCRKVYENSTDQTTGKITGTPSLYEVYDPRYRPWYLASQIGQYYTDPYLFNEDNNLGITAVRQIITASDQFLGVFGVDYDLLTIDSALYDVSYQNVGGSAGDYAVFVVEVDGHLISTSVLGASVETINGTATQVHATNSSNAIIASVSRKIMESKSLGGGGGYVAANGTVLIVEVEGKGRYWAQAQKVKNGYGLNWFVVVAEPVSCDVGFYVPIANTERDCRRCPEGARCLGGSFLPFPQPGYWVDRSSFLFGSKFYSCVFDTCRGYSYDPSSTTLECWTELNFNHSKCQEEDLVCSQGSEGPLCGTCSDGYHYESTTRNCISCGEGNMVSQMIIFWSLAFTGVILFGLLFIAGRRDYMKNGPLAIAARRVWAKLLTLPPFNLLKHVDRGMGKVLWVTAQILSTVSWNLSLEFPDPFDSLFVSRLQYFQLDFVPMKCFIKGDNFITRVCVISFAPIVLAVINLIVYIVRQKMIVGISNVASLRLSEFGTSATSKVTNQHAYFALLLSYLVLPICSLVQFSALNCITLQDGSSYLKADTSVDCKTNSFRVFIALDVCLIIAYQSVPMIWFLLLWRDRHKINPLGFLDDRRKRLEGSHTVNETSLRFVSRDTISKKTRSEDYSIKYLAFLWQDYKPSKWYFEVTEMYRRTLFVAVIPLVGGEGVFRAILGTMLAMCMVAYLSEASPFISETTNSLLVTAQYQILFTFFVAVIISSDAVDSLHLTEFGLGLLLLCVNMVLLITVIGCCFSRLLQERQQQRWKHEFTPEELFILMEFMNENACSDDFEYTNSGALEMRGSSSEGRHSSQVVNRRKTSDEVLKKHLLNPEAISLDQKVGVGGFGEVFKGRCFNAVVAVKTITDVTEQNLGIFQSEILVTSILRHPNIVNFVGACWSKELICLAVEWMPNGTLGDMLFEAHRTGGLEWGFGLLRMATDIARGMAYLHSLDHFNEVDAQSYTGIIHGDLAPGNCLLGDALGTVKVSDFGSSHAIGRMLQDAPDQNSFNGVLGTPPFCAPELVRHDVYDEKVDVYSFGMVLASLVIDQDLLRFIKKQWRRTGQAQGQTSSPNHANLSLLASYDDELNTILSHVYSGEWKLFDMEKQPIDVNGEYPEQVFKLIAKCTRFKPMERPSFHDILEYLHFTCEKEIELMSQNMSKKARNSLNVLGDVVAVQQRGSVVQASLSFSISKPADQLSLLPSLTLPKSQEPINHVHEAKRKSSLKSSSSPSLVKKTVRMDLVPSAQEHSETSTNL